MNQNHAEILVVFYKILVRRDLAVPVDLEAKLMECGINPETINVNIVNTKETEDYGC